MLHYGYGWTGEGGGYSVEWALVPSLFHFSISHFLDLYDKISFIISQWKRESTVQNFMEEDLKVLLPNSVMLGMRTQNYFLFVCKWVIHLKNSVPKTGETNTRTRAFHSQLSVFCLSHTASLLPQTSPLVSLLSFEAWDSECFWHNNWESCA